MREKFTKWFVKKGYIFAYIHLGGFKDVYLCPWYIKPIAYFLLSPSVYFQERGKQIVEWLLDGIKSVEKTALEELKQNEA